MKGNTFKYPIVTTFSMRNLKAG